LTATCLPFLAAFFKAVLEGEGDGSGTAGEGKGKLIAPKAWEGEEVSRMKGRTVVR
jgi:hypothetical protein